MMKKYLFLLMCGFSTLALASEGDLNETTNQLQKVTLEEREVGEDFLVPTADVLPKDWFSEDWGNELLDSISEKEYDGDLGDLEDFLPSSSSHPSAVALIPRAQSSIKKKTPVKIFGVGRERPLLPRPTTFQGMKWVAIAPPSEPFIMSHAPMSGVPCLTQHPFQGRQSPALASPGQNKFVGSVMTTTPSQFCPPTTSAYFYDDSGRFCTNQEQIRQKIGQQTASKNEIGTPQEELTFTSVESHNIFPYQ